ncbi:MAG TPA: hypothetical protein VF110_01990 [Burkholderiales bacterium]
MRSLLKILLVVASFAAHAQDCPKIDLVTGECATYRTSFGCATHVDGGRVVGRVCIDQELVAGTPVRA